MVLKPGPVIPEEIRGKNNNPVQINEKNLSSAKTVSTQGKTVNTQAKTVPQSVPLQPGSAVLNAASLGLPKDILSQTLLAFTKFFSIAPKPDLLNALRKEVLASSSSSPENAKERNGLEARTLAALAAAGKGVILDPDCLERYSITADRDDFRDDFDKGDSRNDFYNGDSGKKSGEDSSDASGDQTNDDFLDFLNRIPDKNGRRWIVIPFTYAEEDTELKVLVRALVKEPSSSLENINNEGWIIADINGPKRNWRFILKKADNLTAYIGINPGLPSKDVKDLRELIKKMGFPDINIHNGEELFLAEILGNVLLPSLYEEV